jgi:uncharacterized protein YprB with RNaseH-like and TPR domain
MMPTEDAVADPRHDRIADLLKSKLDEIRVRDGELGQRDRFRGRPAARHGAGPGQAFEGYDGAGPDAPRTAPAADVPSASATAGAPAIPQYGEVFLPTPDVSESVGARLRARAAVPTFDGPPEDEVEALRSKWLQAYRGATPAEAVGGHPSRSHRDLIEVLEVRTVRVQTPEAFDVRQRLARNLALVPGVREATAVRLREEGYADLEALCAHERFGVHARRLCRQLRDGDTAGLVDRVGARLGRSAPLALALCSFLDPSDLLFLDIETMGLFGGSPIVVAGLAHATGGALQMRQWIAASPDAEAALVREVADAAASRGALVTFNGRSFDWPYICGRAAFWGRPVRSDPAHFDLLPFSRRAWRGKTTDCRLSTLAREVLGLHRAEDLPGALVPRFYQEYLDDPAHRAGLLAAIAVHNRHDVEETVRLFGALVARGDADA